MLEYAEDKIPTERYTRAFRGPHGVREPGMVEVLVTGAVRPPSFLKGVMVPLWTAREAKSVIRARTA
jgi:hypothetical protein